MANLTQLPPDPSGTHPLVTWCRRVRNAIMERTIIAGSGVSVDYLPNGTRIGIHRKAPSSVEATAVAFMGEWDSTASYSEGDIVILGSNNRSSVARNNSDQIYSQGLSAGMYIAKRSVPVGTSPVEPNTSPEEGDTYWETMSKGAFRLLAIRESSETNSAISLDSRTPNGSVSIALSACNGKTLTIREVNVCVNGVARRMMILGSAPY